MSKTIEGLDPKSPYVGNFHHGQNFKHSKIDNAAPTNRLQNRWRSQPDMSSESTLNPQALAAWRLGKANASLRKLHSIFEQGEDQHHFHHHIVPTPTEKKTFVQRCVSDPIISLRERLVLDGIPATPELCALQAILPKQVCEGQDLRCAKDLHITISHLA